MKHKIVCWPASSHPEKMTANCLSAFFLKNFLPSKVIFIRTTCIKFFISNFGRRNISFTIELQTCSTTIMPIFILINLNLIIVLLDCYTYLQNISYFLNIYAVITCFCYVLIILLYYNIIRFSHFFQMCSKSFQINF